MLRARHVVPDEQLWTGVELDVDAPLAVLRRLLRHDRAVRLTRRGVGEVAGRPGFHRVDVDVAHDGDDGAVGAVKPVEILERRGPAYRLDLARMPHPGPTVRVRTEPGLEVLLEQHADRLRLGPEAPLLHDHLALGVELAQHR